MATTNQLFQFNGQLYQQTDGVAMGSPLGPLMANVFMCHLEETLTRDGLMPQLYKRHVDDILARMPSADVATEFLSSSLWITRSLLSALKSSRTELNLKLKFTKSQQTLDCSYTSKVRLFNKDKDTSCLCLVVYNRGFQCRMCQVALYI